MEQGVNGKPTHDVASGRGRMVQSYKDLEVWKRSVSLTTKIYLLTSSFPSSERYGLTSQIRRASTSIAANIAEGWGRGTRGEYVQFLTVARGSLMELETHLIVACNLSFVKEGDLSAVSSLIKEIEKMLNRLIWVLKTKKVKS